MPEFVAKSAFWPGLYVAVFVLLPFVVVILILKVAFPSAKSSNSAVPAVEVAKFGKVDDEPSPQLGQLQYSL